MPNLTTIRALTMQDIVQLMERAKAFEQKKFHDQKSMIIGNLFLEPSTRTRCSFEVAEKRLGFHVLNLEGETSSTQKGESLIDTVKTLESVGADALVIRSRETGYYHDLCAKTTLPIINAGDGSGDHPTQALLDLYTLLEEFGSLEGRTISIIGDLRHSRVANSDAELFQRFGARVLLSGPEAYQRKELPGTWCQVDQAIEESDAVMMLRIQHERHTSRDHQEETYLEKYGLTYDRAKRMRKGSIIMHPAPFNRDVEIASELVESPRSRIFRQMENGVAVRMAVLEWALKSKEVVNDGTSY